MRTVLTIVPEMKPHSESDQVCEPATSVQECWWSWTQMRGLSTGKRRKYFPQAHPQTLITTSPFQNTCLFIISGPVQPWVVCAFIPAGPVQHNACFITLCWDGVVVTDPAQPLSPAVSSRCSHSFSSVFAGFLQPLVFYPDALQYG